MQFGPKRFLGVALVIALALMLALPASGVGAPGRSPRGRALPCPLALEVAAQGY